MWSLVDTVLLYYYRLSLDCNVSKLAKFILFFADDTNIFCSGNNLKELQGMINGVLAKLAKWFAVNKLTLNQSKTNYMIFQNRPPDI